MKRLPVPKGSAAGTLLCLILCLPSWQALAADDVSDLKRAVELLQAQNRELVKRLESLEAEKAPRRPVTLAEPAAKTTRPDPAPQAAQVAAPRTQDRTPAPPAATPRGLSLEQRLTDLEVAKTAQEDAVRSIVRSTVSTFGPKINEFVTLGGSLEITAGKTSNFQRQRSDSIEVSTAELDLEIRANEWMVGNLVIVYNSGTNVLFPTTQGFNVGVDRLTLDKAFVTIGDVQRFPLFVKAGLDYLPFGVSTGIQRADSLSIVSPLTIEAFETRKTSIGIGFGLPTPALGPPGQPVIVPPVRPMAINPLVSALSRQLGYQRPPMRPQAPLPVTLPPEAPPFYGIFNVYDSSNNDIPTRRLTASYNARLGYRLGGHCGRPYSELTSSYVCPWSVDFNVDYSSSVFDSRFLQSEYVPFINQIGTVPGMAASAKMTLGRFLLVGEWNGAMRAARFIDGTGRPVRMMPSAWQAALGYQFDWNPWMDAIGSQGTFVGVGYSGTYGLAGVTDVTTGAPTRVGFLPQSRVSFTAGEWVLENTKLAIEYSHNWDYPIAKGGTGRQADGIFLALTYNW